ncbi:MAG TPA: cation:proton antiporter [Candidatus Aerophobetes bacterium]|nr:cation:proton antiporter [Candidatus Aerophobetes bacterium]
MAEEDFLLNLLWMTALILAVLAFLSLYRVIFGPTSYDRLLGVNLISSMVTVIIVILAIRFQRRIYMDVALVYALLSFIGVIALAKYLRAGIR